MSITSPLNRKLSTDCFQRMAAVGVMSIAALSGCATFETSRAPYCDGDCSVTSECAVGERWFCSNCSSHGTGCGADTVVVTRCGAVCQGVCGELLRAEDFPPGAIPATPGTYVRGYSRAMVSEAEQFHWLVERHEWYAGGNALGPEGLRHVRALAAELVNGGDCGQPIVVEAAEPRVERGMPIEVAIADAAAVDEARRAVVIQTLTENGFPSAEQRVIVHPVDRVGLRGVETPQVYNRAFSGFGGGQRGGGVGGRGGGFGGGGGGFGGGGFGGGGGIGLF